MPDAQVEVIRLVDSLNTSQDNSCQWCELGVCEYCEDNTDGATRRYNNQVADEPPPDAESVSEFG